MIVCVTRGRNSRVHRTPSPPFLPPHSNGSYTVHKIPSRIRAVGMGDGECFPKDGDRTPRVAFCVLRGGGYSWGSQWETTTPTNSIRLGVIKSPIVGSALVNKDGSPAKNLTKGANQQYFIGFSDSVGFGIQAGFDVNS